MRQETPVKSNNIFVKVVKGKQLKPSLKTTPSKSYKIEAELTWKVKNLIERAHGSFLVNTSCTRPILNQAKARRLKISVHHRDT